MAFPKFPTGFVFGTADATRPGGEQDVALLQRLGAPGYRFAVSWRELQPGGRGAFDPDARARYDRLVDELLEAGLRPSATLYAGELPETLAADGGWLNRATVDAFGDYAETVADLIGDRVPEWVPVQDPNVAGYLGYGLGTIAPGRRAGWGVVAAMHHLLLAHGRGVQVLRAAGVESVGCANHHEPIWPLSEDPADVGAAKLIDLAWNAVPLEAMLMGRYPRDIAGLADEVTMPGDMAVIRSPLDFYGVNFFAPQRIGASAEGDDIPFRMVPLVGYPATDTGWGVVPTALREWLIITRSRYRAAMPPIVVTECGAAYDAPMVDGEVDDQARIDYLEAHLEAVSAAIERGVDVRGFYAYTLLDRDGWEAPFTGKDWEDGVGGKYGLVHVDAAGVRTPKRSFGWYADMVAAHAEGAPTG
ncbi:family 1 glycosylhydrolase [Nocardioides sp. NPDC006303]|uniref:glycoside hydrolase family 1 protein n=1 Tax=Nocardioides sp. NPDC006303 TaxID=3156747 RepID=UPI00339F6AF0